MSRSILSTQAVLAAKTIKEKSEISPAFQRAIADTVRKSIHSEFMKIRSSALPAVSEKEQGEIERRYKKPSRISAKTFMIEI